MEQQPGIMEIITVIAFVLALVGSMLRVKKAGRSQWYLHVGKGGDLDGNRSCNRDDGDGDSGGGDSGGGDGGGGGGD